MKFKIENIIFPFTYSLGISLYFILLSLNISTVISTYIPLTLVGILVIIFERLYPYREDWIGKKEDIVQDLLFMIFIQVIFSKILLITFVYLKNNFITIDHSFLSLWPHELPILLQGILMVLIIDFFRYWLHRFSHNLPFLWRLHAVHHSPDKLYWLNVGRFHPIERTLQFSIDSIPFILLGVDEKVLSLYYLFFAMNGFFQHCNIKLNYGFLNYIFSSAELHRWHHSKIILESNSNYSNTTIIWDIIFNTYFNPKSNYVKKLGLKNELYPKDFFTQLKTPFFNRLDKFNYPIGSFQDLIINMIFKMKIILTKYLYIISFENSFKNPADLQHKVLKKILENNRNTSYLLKYKDIMSNEKYIQSIPICEYDDIKSHLLEDFKNDIVLFNQTSGTSGNPKYIPITNQILKQTKINQSIFTYYIYKKNPISFKGSLLGIVSPAIEGYTDHNIPYGSASGLIYKSMPSVLKSKYAIPYFVFEIQNYEIKYYTIALFALAKNDLTYIGTANSGTLIKIFDLVISKFDELLADLKNGTFKYINEINQEVYRRIKNSLSVSKNRLNYLGQLQNNNSFSIRNIWPYLNQIVSWKGGNAGLGLKHISENYTHNIDIHELGYIASEGRFTITNENNISLPLIQNIFFEFIDKNDFENELNKFKLIHELELGSQYYIFITTFNGLYRYHINDIIEVTGKFKNTPTFKFVQKGKGFTNLAGEKLYETQIIDLFHRLNIANSNIINNILLLANESSNTYELYFETVEKKTALDVFYINSLISSINIEFAQKFQSGRISVKEVFQLVPGSFEKLKAFEIANGIRESQYKLQLLRYKSNLKFPFEQFLWK